MSYCKRCGAMGHYAGQCKKPNGVTPVVTETLDTKSVTPDVTRKRKTVRVLVIEALAKRDGWKCGICAKDLEEAEAVHLDHKVALASGGRDELDNLQLAHSVCNAQKGSGREWPIVVHLAPHAGKKHCPTCRCETTYASNADRQRAYRLRLREREKRSA